MAETPQPALPRHERTIETLGPDFYDPVAPAAFPASILRFRNDRAAAGIGLAVLGDDDWLLRFARFAPFEGGLPQPLALRYHGHQFRAYNPEIGDGRGFLYAQLRDRAGRLMDLGTKGSGQTPHSRFGDGRLTLKGGVREVLATEMLEALGVDTSRTLSLVETGEALHRGDEPSPTRSAVLVRLSHGHIRIGSFQRLATLGDTAGLARLVDYVLDHLPARLAEGPGVAPSSEPSPSPPPPPSGRGERALALLRNTVAATARLAASYMAAGFVHGVLNSDNINVTGESFDYGPWRFAPTYDPAFTAAYFDHAGLYAFGRQAEAILWDVMQLAASLLPLAPQDGLEAALDGFVPAYRHALARHMLWRLGLDPAEPTADVALAATIEKALVESQAPLDAFWFDWRGGRPRRNDDAYGAAFDALRDGLADRTARADALAHPYWSGDAPCAMPIEEVEAIWAPIAASDDWSAFDAKVAAIRHMGAAMAPPLSF